MPNYAQGNLETPLQALFKGSLGYSFGTKTAVSISASPTGLVRNIASGKVQVLLTTGAAHGFQAGQLLSIAGSGSVGGTFFDGNYLIVSTPLTTTAVLIPIDPTLIHQALDTGGGGKATSIAADQPAVVPQAGQAFALISSPLSDNPAGFSADGFFLAAPGSFEVDIQVAEVDADANYQTAPNANITTVDTTNNTFHYDGANVSARFVRMLIRSRANAVGFFGSIKR